VAPLGVFFGGSPLVKDKPQQSKSGRSGPVFIPSRPSHVNVFRIPGLSLSPQGGVAPGLVDAVQPLTILSFHVAKALRKKAIGEARLEP
jgi:hypothetical protein